MRFLSMVLLCVAVTSALSPFNLAARQEPPLTSETSYITQTTAETATITSLVFTTSVDDIITLNNCTVLLFENFYTLPFSVSTYYDTEISVLTVTQDVTLDPLTSTLDEFFTSIIPASTITETATITAPAPTTTHALTSWVTSTLTKTEDIVQDFVTSVITTVSTLDVVQSVTSTFVTEVTICHTTSTYTETLVGISIVSVTDYSYSTTGTCGPTTTSTGLAPGVTITSYIDFQCSIAGNSTTLSTTTQGTWPACLQQGTSILGQSHGFVQWNFLTRECDVVRGYGSVSTVEVYLIWCASVQYTAIQVFCNQDIVPSYESPGNFIQLDESIQPSWEYCLQHAVAYLNGRQGWVTYASEISQGQFCNIFGNATAGTFVEAYERMWWDYAAIGFSDIQSSPNLSCTPPPSPPVPVIPAICADAAINGPVNLLQVTVEPWCNFECVGYSASGLDEGLGIREYHDCLAAAGDLAIMEQLLISYVSWSTTTNECDLLLNTEQLPNAPGAVGNATSVCGIVTVAHFSDPGCTPVQFEPTQSNGGVGWNVLCGFQCELEGGNGTFWSSTFESWTDCYSHTNDVSDNPGAGVVINWNQVTNQCTLSKPVTNAVLRRQYNPYSDCAVYVSGLNDVILTPGFVL